MYCLINFGLLIKPIKSAFPLYLSFSLVSESHKMTTVIKKDDLIDYYNSDYSVFKPHIYYMDEPEHLIHLFNEIRKYISEQKLIEYLGLE